MSKLQRVRDILTGLLMICAAVLMVLLPELGYVLVALALCVSLILTGLRRIVYYLTMARHMVGGKSSLYTGVLLYDAGLFIANLDTIPQVYVMLYLLGCHLFSGVLSVMRALEARRLDAPSWKWTMAHGVANVLVAITCAFFIHSMETVVLIYSVGLVYSGAVRIASAFRRTAIVYIA